MMIKSVFNSYVCEAKKMGGGRVVLFRNINTPGLNQRIKQEKCYLEVLFLFFLFLVELFYKKKKKHIN